MPFTKVVLGLGPTLLGRFLDERCMWPGSVPIHPGMSSEPHRPWIKLELPPGAGRDYWADFLRDLDAWLRHRGDGVTIFDVKPVRDEPAGSPTVDRRTGIERRTG